MEQNRKDIVIILQRYFLNSGDRLHDFFVGVTVLDMTDPQPGQYPLCQSQYIGAATNGQILDLVCNPGVQGRYVWIQIPTGTFEILTLCEVEVYTHDVPGNLY